MAKSSKQLDRNGAAAQALRIYVENWFRPEPLSFKCACSILDKMLVNVSILNKIMKEEAVRELTEEA